MIDKCGGENFISPWMKTKAPQRSASVLRLPVVKCGDCGPAPVLSWGSRGAKREVRTQTNYHFMTKRFFCRRYIIDLPFKGRSLWSGFGRLGLKGGKRGLASVVNVLNVVKMDWSMYVYDHKQLSESSNEDNSFKLCTFKGWKFIIKRVIICHMWTNEKNRE